MQAGGRKRVLITGAAGCVGQYIVDELLAASPHDLVLLVRDPARLPDYGAAARRVEIIRADMTEVESYRERLGHIDAAFLVAAAWGGEQTEAVNLTANLALTDLLAAGGADRVYYFSTASVLDHEHRLLPAAFELGSAYIRSKYRLVEEIEKRADRIRVVGLFPTVIVGGGPDGKPASHFANLLREARPYLRIACALTAEARLHLIHARDIARVARHLLDSDTADGGKGGRIVLGNPAITLDRMLREVRDHMGFWSPLRFKLRDGLAEFLIRAFRIQLTPWDRYCMQHRDMSHRDPVSPATFGLPAHAPDIAAQFRSVGIVR